MGDCPEASGVAVTSNSSSQVTLARRNSRARNAAGTLTGSGSLSASAAGTVSRITFVPVNGTRVSERRIASRSRTTSVPRIPSVAKATVTQKMGNMTPSLIAKGISAAARRETNHNSPHIRHNASSPSSAPKPNIQRGVSQVFSQVAIVLLHRLDLSAPPPCAPAWYGHQSIMDAKVSILARRLADQLFTPANITAQGRFDIREEVVQDARHPLCHHQHPTIREVLHVSGDLMACRDADRREAKANALHHAAEIYVASFGLRSVRHL